MKSEGMPQQVRETKPRVCYVLTRSLLVLLLAILTLANWKLSTSVLTMYCKMGRIQAGQRARLRLDGFAWTEYGQVSATVSRVASEPRSGRVRVELAVNPESAPLIPSQHGLPGKVEIEIERVSPAELAMRGVGKMLSQKIETRGF